MTEKSGANPNVARFSLIKKFGLSKNYMFLFYVVLLALTVVLSLFTIDFDFKQLRTAKYWGNLAINYGLSIAALFAASKDGFDKGKNRPRFLENLDSLNRTIKTVIDRQLIFVLTDYLQVKYLEDKERFIKDTLTKNGIRPELLTFSVRELKKRRRELELSGDQISVLIKIKRGKYRVSKVSSADLISSYSSDREKGTGPTYGAGKRLIDLALPRLIGMFLLSALFASVLIDVAGGESGANIAMNLVIRIFTVVSSIAFGYMNGFTVDNELISVLNCRETILHVFLERLDSGDYVPDLKEGAKLPQKKQIESEIKTEEKEEYEIIEVTPEEAERLMKKDRLNGE